MTFFQGSADSVEVSKEADIPVWVMGSPGSGKTTAALKLALTLSAAKKNVIVVFCDPFTPVIPTVLPADTNHDTSLGSLLTAPALTQAKLLNACVPTEKNEYISFLGYRAGESLMRYPQITRDKAVEFFILLRYLADYVIIDCTSAFEADPASIVAIELADKVLRLGTANLKGVSYYLTHNPMKNGYLVPVLAAGLALLPFYYVKLTAGRHKKQINTELETALSIITTSYLRGKNTIIRAIEENQPYLNPPVAEVFRNFLLQAKLINSNTKEALEGLKVGIDNSVFHEWVDAVIACQDDYNLKTILPPIVAKLSDMRVVSAELDLLLFEPVKEYITMAQSDETIITYLGMGIIRFSEPDPEPPKESNVTYRCDTEVITAVTLTTGSQKTPDNPAYARFTINGRTYSHNSIYIPDGGSQLAWQ